MKQLGGAAFGLSATSQMTASDRAAARIKVGQIGVAHAHAAKLAVYRQLPDYEVVGIVEPNADLRKSAATQNAFRDLPWMTQEQLLNVTGLQAVLVETRVADLLGIAESCVAAGKHIHLDKPAGTSLPQFRRILESARRQHLLVQMGYMYRYNPGVLMLREFLAKGWLGEPFEVHAVMSKVLSQPQRAEVAQFTGGMMFELGCHLIDLVVGVMGKPADVATFPLHSARRADNLVDNMLAVFSYPRATATVKSTGLEVEGFERRHLVVCGTEGTLHIQPLDNPAVRVALSSVQGPYRKGYQEVKFPKYSRYVADAADMARILRGEKASEFSYEHDLHVQETVLKASGMTLTK